MRWLAQLWSVVFALALVGCRSNDVVVVERVTTNVIVPAHYGPSSTVEMPGGYSFSTGDNVYHPAVTAVVTNLDVVIKQGKVRYTIEGFKRP